MRKKIASVLPALVLVVSLVLVIIPQVEVGAATQNEEFSESDTFVVPEVVTKITVEVWGGGGAGGGSTNAGGWRARGGAGGGGGAYASSTLSVTPGQTLQVVIGAGGTGITGDDGNAGSPSFAGPDTNPDNALVRAAGGSGGTGNTDGGSPLGGGGGTVEDSIGQTRIAGGDGGNGATGQLWNTSSGAGGDGAYGGGSGGAVLSSGTSDGNPGDVPGGGGGGARTQRNDGSRAGGAGAAGKVVITWVTYDLTISSTEGGSVTTPGEDTFTYGEEFVVDLVATPDEGYRFDEWTGDVGTIADVNATATNITMNGDYSITANFVRQYDLKTNSTEGGSVTTPGEDTFTYDEGTVVDLVAEAEEYYWFANWTGDVSTIADVYAASTNITMDAAKNVTANFALLSYNLTTNSTIGGSVTGPGEDTFTYDYGTVVDLTAEAVEGYQFVAWTGNVSTIADVYAASTTITMNGDYSITANFETGYLTVITQAATGISTSSATLNMNYTMGGFSQVEVRFAYKKSTSSIWYYTDWVSKSVDGTHAESLTGLSSSTEYKFTAQLRGSASVEGTTLQFTTEKIPNTPSGFYPPPWGSCFIATAAYGTPTAEQVDVLREFRDTVLLESTAGSQFVSLYYQFSPPIANVIAENSFLRTLVRELLVDPIVWVVEVTGNIWRN